MKSKCSRERTRSMSHMFDVTDIKFLFSFCCATGKKKNVPLFLQTAAETSRMVTSLIVSLWMVANRSSINMLHWKGISLGLTKKIKSMHTSIWFRIRIKKFILTAGKTLHKINKIFYFMHWWNKSAFIIIFRINT